MTDRNDWDIERAIDAMTKAGGLSRRTLMRRAGAPCSRQELLSEVWGYDFDPGTNVVDACVARLRSKLPDDIVRTVRNVGYRLQAA